MAAQIRADLGDPWLLVNAAGVFSIQLLPDLEEQEWDLILDTNLKGPFLTCREFLPTMIAAKSGCVVNIASTAGNCVTTSAPIVAVPAGMSGSVAS